MCKEKKRRGERAEMKVREQENSRDSKVNWTSEKLRKLENVQETVSRRRQNSHSTAAEKTNPIKPKSRKGAE